MQSIWEKELVEHKTDMTIIGAGFSGLWTAFFLVQQNPGLRIQLIDKEPLPKGASTRNAGFACFGSASELIMNTSTQGKERALHWALERWRGIQLIKKYFGENITYQPCGGYELFDDKTLFEKCVESIQEYNSYFEAYTGKKTTYSVADKSVESFGFNDFKNAMLNSQEGSINSGQLIKALQNSLFVNNVRIYRGIEFTDYLVNNDCVSVRTSVGEFTTKHLCFATNGLSPKSLHITPGRGQVLLTKPIKNLRFKGTFHMDKGFTYFRNVGNQVLIGGGRNIAVQEETTDKYAITDTIQHFLEKLLQERILPNQKFEIENRWAGIMGFTATHEPICEVRSSRISVIAGMNGMGVALAPRLGQILAEEVGLHR